jgi:pyruvate/2-oxoglutarate dehydrogenase complex dihydrolipoamide dehydrogenase (E3) component
VRVTKLPISAVLRTQTISETSGFMKALLDAQSDRILGFTMLGPEAGEVMAIVQTAMLAGLPYTGLRDAIFTPRRWPKVSSFCWRMSPPRP